MQIESFQLIDRVAELSIADGTIRTESAVPASSIIFERHFAGQPLMPGVLLVEVMAQASGWLVIATVKFESMPFLVQVKKAKMRGFVRPPSALVADATLVHQGSGFAVTRATLTGDGNPVCDGEFTFRMLDFPNEEFIAGVRRTAKEIGLAMGAS
jgi:3-hydroxyacyl-[acyl-carrier-protein] dehydratase